MKNNFQKILKLVKNNELNQSIEAINGILNHEKNFDLISLKGFVYLKLKKFNKSYSCYSLAIKINNKSFPCFFWRATASFELGEFEKSIIDFKKALTINSKLYEVYENIGKCYSNLGKNSQSVDYYNLALEINPNNPRLIEVLAEKLTETIAPSNKINNVIKIDRAIKNLQFKYSYNSIIENKNIINFFSKAEDIINKDFKNLSFNESQIFRKNNLKLNCDRHFTIFRNYKIIPKFCFSCIKVTIYIENVIDLVKLFFIFNYISLPNNNLRKCMIDLRADTKKNYKGFIYCRSYDEAQEIKNIVDDIIKKNISDKIEVNIKRGCSAFNKEYPGYENVIDSKIKYNNEWKKYEDAVDKKFPKFKLINKNQQTVSGISFHDIMIIKNWLFFAKLTNDNSYKKIETKINFNPFLEEIIKKNKFQN